MNKGLKNKGLGSWFCLAAALVALITGISSIRGGGIVGEHDVLFCGPDEVVTLSHSAGSRGVFADGAVQAALYIAALAPGYYTMTDLLRGKLICE